MCHAVTLHIKSQLRISALPSTQKLLTVRKDELTVHDSKKKIN